MLKLFNMYNTLSSKSIIAIFSIAMLWNALHAATQPVKRSARLDITALNQHNSLTAIAVSNNGRLANFHWEKDGGRNKLRALFPATVNWQQSTFTFKPSQDGKAVISMRGPYLKLGKQLKPVHIDYRLLVVDGKVLFQADDSAPLTVWHNTPNYHQFDLEKNKAVTVQVSYKLSYAPTNFQAANEALKIDLRSFANMGFKDTIAGDGKGGWSDQGAENDLKHFDITQQQFGMIPFHIIDPASNNGNAVLTFASKHISPLVSLKKAEVKLAPKDDKCGYQYLYLLHTTCWNSSKKGDLVGTIKVEMTNGETIDYKIRNKEDVCDWWMPLPIENGAVVYEYRKNPTAGGAVGLYLSRFILSDVPQQVKKVSFETAGKSIWIVLGATLSNQHIKLKKNMAPVKIQANATWRPVTFGNFQIKAGSALDLSTLIDKGSVAQKGRVVIRNRHFEYEKTPGKKVRFAGCSIAGSELAACQTKADIKEFVRQIKRHGFSMVRTHFLDFFLMKGGQADFDFNPDNLDKFDYLIKCMKEEGLYLYFDCMTGWSGYKKGTGWQARGIIDLKGSMLWDENTRKHWLTGVQKLLTRQNPYTGITLARDPVLVATVFFNEQELWQKNTYDAPEFKAQWAKWLAAKYGTLKELKQAWTTHSAPYRLSPEVSSFSQVPFILYGSSPPAIDANSFLLAQMNSIDNWYVNEFNKLGCRTAESNWDCRKEIIYLAARANMNSVSMHGYHAHPSSWVSPNSMQSQDSSIKSQSPGRYFTHMALSRFTDRPFLITEYLHCFWNPYRFEEGLLMGAGAAWQDMDCLIAHAKPVRTVADSKPIRTFFNYNDPIQRASEVVAKLLFIRRDLKPAAKNVELVLNIDDVLKNGKAQSTINHEYGKLAFMTGLGVKIKNAPLPPGITPIKADLILENSVVSNPQPKTLWSELMPTLKKSGILPKQNASRPLDGYLVSADNSLTLDSKQGTFKVDTEHLEGASFTTPAKHIILNALTIKSCSVPAAITVTSLDHKPLHTSKHLLIICATNALNTNMEFFGEDRRFLKSLGTAPVLLQTSQLDLSLKSLATSATLWSLAFSGERQETLPITLKNGQLHFKIDTSTLKTPTVFFEVELN